jgi:hypothetical protein
VRDSIEKDEVNQVGGVSMIRKLSILLIASLFVACLSSCALAAQPSFGSLAAPTAPSTGLVIDSPSNGSYLNSANITVHWHLVGPTSAIQNYSVKMDEEDWINNFTRTSITLINPEDGTHRVNVLAWTEFDGVYSASVHFIVDTISPTVIAYSPTGNNVPITTIITAPSNPWNWSVDERRSGYSAGTATM